MGCTVRSYHITYVIGTFSLLLPSADYQAKLEIRVMSGALEGVRVLDLSRYIAGPTVGQILGDLGADVIKVERPGEGDDLRRVGNITLPPGPDGKKLESNFYVAYNRNKRGITADIGKPEGRQAVLDLAARSDVLVENYKTGTLARYGLDYASLKDANPRLVYCSVTGYGQSGPYRERPGFDPVFQAQCGLMSVTGVADGDPGAGPVKIGISIVDHMSGLNGAIAVLAALHERGASGQGQLIDIALLECGVATMSHAAQQYLMGGGSPVRLGLAGSGGAPVGLLPCEDGDLFIAVAVNFQFEQICKTLGCPELIADPRFESNALRTENRRVLAALLGGKSATWKKAELLEAFIKASVPAGYHNTMQGVFDDEQILSRHVAVSLPHPQDPELRVVASPLRLERTPPQYKRHPPRIGEHTDEVLSSVLGWSAERISRARASGAV
jgi:crotonobetainyl-CoA:carnitine CoA-transferase CaiB-like acyl-CoA transferase